MPGGAAYFNGKTNNMMFGLTTLFADSSDLYAETLNN